jgi:glycine hydroxymethyltransferase
LSGGTDNHLLLVDLRDKLPDNTVKEVAVWMESAGMIANHNGIPKDPRPPMQTSGIRLGTPAVTTRGMGTKEMDKIADWIDHVITSKGDESVHEAVRKEIVSFCSNFPLPH